MSSPVSQKPSKTRRYEGLESGGKMISTALTFTALTFPSLAE